MIGLKNNKFVVKHKTDILAGASALVIGLLIHAFALTNLLQNYDNITTSLHGFGCGVDSGRWLLSILSMGIHYFFGGYNLPWFNGFITIVILAISAGFLNSIFGIRNNALSIILGGIFISFPTVSSTLFFRFVSMYDAFAIFLAIVSVWILQHYKFGFILSAVCVAMSMGIYQAYFPMTTTILIVLLMQTTLHGELTFGQIFKKALFYLGFLILALLAYFACQKATMVILNAELNDYQGISKMGQINIAELPNMVAETFVTVIKLPFSDYCAVVPNVIMRAFLVPLYLFTFICIVVLCIKRCKHFQWIWMIVFGIMFPVAINLIRIMAPDGIVYTMMLYSFVFIYIFPIVVVNEFKHSLPLICKRKLPSCIVTIISVILAVMIAFYAYFANANYTAQYYTTKQTENYFNSLMTQVRMTEGYTSSCEWAFIGDRFEDPLLSPEWDEIPLYGGNGTTYINVNAYSRTRWIITYFGYELPMASDETVDRLKNNSIVQDMPCFPDEGSIRIIDGTVVIKLEDFDS